MADTTELKTFVIKVESNLDDYAKDAIKAEKAASDLKTTNEELAKSGATPEQMKIANAELKVRNDEYKKAEALLKNAVAVVKAETGSRKQLELAIRLGRQELGKMPEMYIKEANSLKTIVNPAYTEHIRKLAALTEMQIKYDQTIKDGRSNVGNYGEAIKTAMGKAGGAVSQLSSAVGGSVGEISSSLMDLASGPIGIVTAAIGLIALAWKRTNENINLYLESADKLSAGVAGYNLEAEKARVDLRRRANGMISEGFRIEQENLLKLTTLKSVLYTGEEKRYFAQLASSGREMQKQGRLLRDQATGIHDKVKWEEQYNKLLREQEIIADSKLQKQVEWEILETNLAKQREIIGSVESTVLEKKQAAIDADIIAATLVKSKDEFITKELTNMKSIAEMTAQEEVYEERIAALMKEKVTIQKEYENDKIKVNKLEKASLKDETDKQKEAKKTIEDQKKIDGKIKEERQKQEVIAEQEAEKFVNAQLARMDKEAEDKWNKEVEFQRILFDFNRKAGQDEYDARIKEAEALAKAELEIQQTLSDSKINLASATANFLSAIAGQNKGLQNAALIAEKALAIAMVVINTTKANATIRTMAAASVIPGPGYLARLGINMAAAQIPINLNRVAAALDIAAIIAATASQIKSNNSATSSGGSSAPTAISSSPAAQRTFAQAQGSSVLTQAQLSQPQLNAIPNQNMLTAADIANALKGLPPPIVTVEDINVKVKSMNKVAVRANI